MSSQTQKSFRVNDCEISPGFCKKQKRRRRNRYKNYILKKKRLKKFSYTNKADSHKSNNFSFKPVSEKIMSNWYWSNYKKAVEWQERHKVAHWKACALALYEENRHLLEIINQMQPGMVSGSTKISRTRGRGNNFSNKEMKMRYSEYSPPKNKVNEDGCSSNQTDSNVEEGCEDAEEVEDDFEFEMSEEMIQFFEQSYKHKMDMKKLKEKEIINNIEQEVQQIQNNKLKRSTEMSFLYGDGSSMITGMETAVQLSFNKYCDNYSPKYWPNIPFRL